MTVREGCGGFDSGQGHDVQPLQRFVADLHCAHQAVDFDQRRFGYCRNCRVVAMFLVFLALERAVPDSIIGY